MKYYSKYVKTERRELTLSTVSGIMNTGQHLRMYQYLPDAHYMTVMLYSGKACI